MRSKPQKVLRGLWFAVAAFVAVGLLLRVMPFGGQSERLFEIKGGTVVAVRGGEVYLRTADGLSALPTGGGPPLRSLASPELRQSPRSQETCTPDGLYYQSDGGSASIIRFLAFNGSKGRVIASGATSGGTLVLSDSCYWLRRIGKVAVEVMRTPLGGGTARVLARAPQSCQLLGAGSQSGSVWWAPEPWDERKGWDLVSYSPGASDLTLWPGFRGYGPPVEVGRSLYWIEYDPQDRSRQLRLVRAGQFGQSGETVLDLSKGDQRVERLRPHDGSLYILLVRGTKTETGYSDPNTGPERMLYRLDTGTGGKLTRVAMLARQPIEPFFDGDFVYFVQRHKREKWFDWSASGLQVDYTHFLYRLPLD